MKRRVVITGLGVISPVGIGKEAFWQNLLGGVSGVTSFDRVTCCPLFRFHSFQARSSVKRRTLTRSSKGFHPNTSTWTAYNELHLGMSP